MERTLAWIELCRDGPGYRFANGCPRTLLATCFGVCARELLGGEGDAAVGDWLVSLQREDGSFADPLHGEDVLCSVVKFTPTYIAWQQSYFALHALDALGRTPRHALRFVEPLLQPRALDAWLDTLPFEDFQWVGNYLRFLLFFALRVEGVASATARRVLDRLDERQDPKTGLWGTEQGASPLNGMAGAAHVFGYARYLGRPIAHRRAALDSALALQRDNGLFGRDPGVDLDAIEILSFDVEDARVKGALARALSALRACGDSDGGHRGYDGEVAYSGLPTLKVARGDKDLWSAWLRPLAIAAAAHHLGQDPGWPARFRDPPSLGWQPREPPC